MNTVKEHFTNEISPFFEGVDEGYSEVRSRGCWQFILLVYSQISDYFIPESLRGSAEDWRKAKLLAGFGIMGAVFGTIFAIFFFILEHIEGVKVVLVCSATFLVIPFLLRKGLNPSRLGNLYTLVLLGGFLSLCWVEGGVRGHAVAWLVSVPLCAMLLSGTNSAIIWSVVTLVSVLGMSVCEFIGITPPVSYPERWHILITSFGYIGLVIFMSLLGILFERGRKNASDQMQLALHESKELNDQLQNLNQEKNEFLGIVAHDLKNPLTVILGMSELLPRVANKSPDKVIDFSCKITRESKRMRDLIVNLLNLKAIEEGRMVFKSEPLEILPLIEQTVENFCGVASKKHIRLNFQACELESKILGDSQAILQVLDNLVSNALKFSKPETTVSIHIHESADNVQIEVKDQGPGISTEDQQRLFERFSRLSNKPTAGENSTGLGLSIVKRIATSMDGDVFCESQLGVGTSFFFKLPKFEEPAC